MYNAYIIFSNLQLIVVLRCNISPDIPQTPQQGHMKGRILLLCKHNYNNSEYCVWRDNTHDRHIGQVVYEAIQTHAHMHSCPSQWHQNTAFQGADGYTVRPWLAVAYVQLCDQKDHMMAVVGL